MRKILSGQSRNKGVTLITLIIAITIFAVFITVFSYVMIAKHGSEALYVQSTQAYAVAQAGVEYAIRYVKDDEVTFFTDPSIYTFSDQNLGNGSFSLSYDDSNNTLTSTGTVGNAERQIILQYFKLLVKGQAITLDPSDQPSEST